MKKEEKKDAYTKLFKDIKKILKADPNEVEQWDEIDKLIEKTKCFTERQKGGIFSELSRLGENVSVTDKFFIGDLMCILKNYKP